MKTEHTLSDLSDSDRESFLALYREYEKLAAKAAKLEADKKEITQTATALASSLGIKKLVFPLWSFSEQPGRETFDENKLLEFGLNIDQINAAKKSGKPFYSFHKRGPKK